MHAFDAPGFSRRVLVRRLAINISLVVGLSLTLVLLPPLSSPSAGFPAFNTYADELPATPATPYRIIVKMRSEPTESSILRDYASLDASMARLGVQTAIPLFDTNRGDSALKQDLGLSQVYVLTLPSSTDLQDALSAFSADPTIEYAEPDFIGYGAGMPDDERFGQQWSLHNTGQSSGEPDADVDAPEAWDISIGTTSTILAIIDTGIDLDHPDLAGKVVPGYDFVNDDDVPQDDHGHGTHVAGIAAAVTNNATGVAGVCPGCRIMPLKALNSENWGYYSWWANAIVHAVDNGADVINMSMGGTDYSQVLRDAVLYAYNANVPIVAAMMNDGDSTAHYPALFAETIATGSTDRYDDRSTFSNFGDHIDLVAPGSSIWSTMWDDTYASWSGTSMATPHVVGVLGLVHSVRPGYTVEELRAILRATADDQVGPPSEDKKGWDTYFGSGRLNAARALQYSVPPADVTISGPATGLVLTDHSFTASVSPITAAQPITYAWQATGPSPVIHTGGLSDTAVFAWPTPGPHAITLTATNFGGTVTDTHIITASTLPPDAILTVCHGGGCDYDSIQNAVDAASDGNVIKVAAGAYTSINNYDGLAQVIFINKNITIQGGYTTAFTDPPDPDANLTTVDAQSGGRVLYITGDVSPTIEGLRITGGDAVGLGGGQGGTDAGGGVCIINANATLRDNQMFGNTAHWGGGLYLLESNATLSGNTIMSNTASHDGGGLYLLESDAALNGNIVISNTASHDGGGLYLWGSDATLSGNTVTANTASHDGGGLYLRESDGTLSNNIIADNQANNAGSGLHIRNSSPRLLHTTIVRNTGGDGSGVYVTSNSAVALTNTILASHAAAITVTAGNTVTLEATLWGTDTADHSGQWANTTDWGGTGTIITGSGNYWGDPAFVDPDDADRNGRGDYHIQPTSAAVDVGVDTVITTDIHSQPRPLGNGYDVGADEAPPHPDLTIAQQATPDPVQAGTQLTYTIYVTNTGNMLLTPTVTDILPDHVTPDSVLTWTPDPITPGGVWMERVVVTVEVGHTGSLTNVVQVTTDEGATGADTNTVIVAEEWIMVGPSQGGIIIAPSGGGVTITVEVPPGAVAETTQLAFTSVPTVTGSPLGFVFAGHAFRLEAYRKGVLHSDLTFEEPITVTIHYTGSDVAGLDENTLELRYWDGDEWSADGITVVERDTVNKRLVTRIEHLSEFALFAQEQQPQKVYLPLVLCQHPGE